MAETSEAHGHGQPEETHGPWWRHGLLSAGAGLVFAALLTLALVVLDAARFAPASAVERAGVDASMRVYAAFPRLLGNVGAESPRSYLFLDVDAAACRRATGAAAGACGSREPLPPGLVARLIAAVAEAPDGPRVVIVDVKPPARPSDRDAWRRAIDSPAGPWIVYPVESRPGDEPGGIRLDPAGRPPWTRAGSRAREAAVETFTDPEAGDGVVRHYPLVVRVEPGGRLLPTMPLVAAALANGTRDQGAANARALDCLFRQPSSAACRGRSMAIRLGPRLYGSASDPAVAPGLVLSADAPPHRVFYSLPSLALDQDSGVADDYRGFLDRYPVSMLMRQDGAIRIPPGLLRDAVVIIGTSEAAGRDWHATPLGAMTGSEVVLNATRAVADFAPMVEPGRPEGGLLSSEIWNDLLERLGPVMLVGVLALGPAWLAIAFVGSRTRTASAWLRAVAGLACCGLFAGGLALALGVELWLHAAALREATESGRPVDLLTPVLGLGLEGYADASVFVLGAIHHQLDAAGRAVAGAVTRGGSRIVRLLRRRRLDDQG